MRKILFITHETSRTGAPFVLLYFLQWLKSNYPKNHVSVLSLYGGDLSDQFKSVSHEYYELSGITTPKQKFHQRLLKKMFGNLGIKFRQPDARRKFVNDLSKKDFDVIYSNTTVSLPFAQEIKMLNGRTKLILHVHELESEINRTIGNFRQYSNDIDIMIAASGMVRDNLIKNQKVPAGKVKVIYEFTKKLVPSDETEPKKVFKIGGSGKVGYRKGTDLFLQVARYLYSNFPDLNTDFTWVGLFPENEKVGLKLELKKLGLTNTINFIGEVEKPELYFKDFDVFLMTSREDPFPLVCIEAGMLGLPIVCFDKATGISEIIGEKGGFIVPYLNIEAMAEKIGFYYNNHKTWKEHSQFNKVEFAKFIAEHQGPKILRLIEDA